MYFIYQDVGRISAKCRDAKVEDLWSLTSFFGYSTQTFVLAVNLLDRFLAMMRVCSHLIRPEALETESKCDVKKLIGYNMTSFFIHSFICHLPLDPAKAPFLCQPQLPPHGSQSDRGGVQLDTHRRTHPHRTVSVHRIWPRAHGEDRRREAQLQVQSHHCLNLSTLVPPDRTFTRHGQVRPLCRGRKWSKT